MTVRVNVRLKSFICKQIARKVQSMDEKMFMIMRRYTHGMRSIPVAPYAL